MNNFSYFLILTLISFQLYETENDPYREEALECFRNSISSFHSKTYNSNGELLNIKTYNLKENILIIETFQSSSKRRDIQKFDLTNLADVYLNKKEKDLWNLKMKFLASAENTETKKVVLLSNCIVEANEECIRTSWKAEDDFVIKTLNASKLIIESNRRLK